MSATELIASSTIEAIAMAVCIWGYANKDKVIAWEYKRLWNPLKKAICKLLRKNEKIVAWANTEKHGTPDAMFKEGDVFSADFTEYAGFDWVLAGFPCTKFSIAQKNGRETKPYSGEGWDLFEQAWRAVQEAKPKYFLLENNKSMAKAVQQEISKIIGFPPVLINSALVSAQNRQRLYWVGKRNADGTYSKVNVEQPIDRGILLKDVLDGNTDREKARAVIGSIGRTTTREYFQKQQGTMTFERVPPYGTVDKARPINAHYPNNCGGFEHRMFSDNPNKQQVDMIAEPIYVGEIPEHKGQYRNGKQPSQQYRVYSVDGKSVAVDRDSRKNIAEPVRIPEPINTTESGEKVRTLMAGYYKYGTATLLTNEGFKGGTTAVADEPVDAETVTKAISQADGKTYRVHKVENGLITIKDKQYPIKLADGYYIIRRLTVRECKRLQTVPEWYEFPVSDSQAYKMLGNGWTCEVIIHLIKSCLAGKVDNFAEQIKFF